MKKGKIRDQQMKHVVSEEIDLILASAANPLLAELGVTQVICSPGASSFTIFVAPLIESHSFSDPNQVRQLLNQAIGYLRTELASVLRIKKSPQLTVTLDPIYLLSRWGR